MATAIKVDCNVGRSDAGRGGAAGAMCIAPTIPPAIRSCWHACRTTKTCPSLPCLCSVRSAPQNTAMRSCCKTPAAASSRKGRLCRLPTMPGTGRTPSPGARTRPGQTAGWVCLARRTTARPSGWPRPPSRRPSRPWCRRLPRPATTRAGPIRAGRFSRGLSSSGPPAWRWKPWDAWAVRRTTRGPGCTARFSV